MKVLVSDKLSESGLSIFKNAEGIELDYQPGLGKDIDKLKEVIKSAHAIAIRSGTNLTADILACADNLKVIGRAGIGVDNVDVEEATKRGIIVMNTPFGNTVTTAEHAISMMCALTRQIPQATMSLKEGKWEKSKFMGSELYQKNLGLIGCGNIGKIVADRALGLRMKVLAFDPFLTDEMAKSLGLIKVELDELFEKADYITLHVPKNDKTANLVNKDAFAKMKKGVYLINCARGGIVNEADLEQAVNDGIVAGAALDVFDKEPVDPNHPLLKLDQVICTPHLGAATSEAQENVAVDVAKQIVDFLTTNTIQNALNTPSISGELLSLLEPHINLASKIGLMQGQLAEEAPKRISIEYGGELADQPTKPLTIACLNGILKPVLEDEEVNSINAPAIAKSRGIHISETCISEAKSFTSFIKVTLEFKDSERVIGGTIFGKVHPRITRFNDAFLELVPEGKILMVHNEDKPGVVGHLGTVLGDNGVNISRLQLALSESAQKAISFYHVTGEITADLLQKVREVEGVISVQEINL